MNTKELGKKILELRKLKGMTQEDLAAKTNLSVRTIQRIESGEVDPRTYTINVLAEALEVNIEELIPKNDKIENRENSIKWLALLHLSGIFILFIPPLLIWILKKNEIPEMDQHGKDVMNFQLSMMIYLFIGAITLIILIGLIFLIFLGIFSTFIIIINTLKVLSDKPYHYPMSIKFIS
jgi:transcriptional regulator with XRE-family HTH domain